MLSNPFVGWEIQFGTISRGHKRTARGIQRTVRRHKKTARGHKKTARGPAWGHKGMKSTWATWGHKKAAEHE